MEDHPRVCGKNFSLSQHGALGQGSPPRVREKRSAAVICIAPTGITPACAGKTRSLKHSQPQTWDHPRVCGKNLLSTAGNSFSTGSPPRVREKPKEYLDGKKITGITPACAGKTRLGMSVSRFLRDHPRVCGKNFSNFASLFDVVGSPPRVREKHSY